MLIASLVANVVLFGMVCGLWARGDSYRSACRVQEEITDAFKEQLVTEQRYKRSLLSTLQQVRAIAAVEIAAVEIEAVEIEAVEIEAVEIEAVQEQADGH